MGLARWDGRRLDNYLEHEGWVGGLMQDPAGAVWFTVNTYNKNESKVLCKIQALAVTCYGKSDGLTEQATPHVSLLRDDAGYLWMLTATSVVGWKPSSVQVYSPDLLKNRSGNGGFRGIDLDRDGSLLVGGFFGLRRIWHGRLDPFLVPGFDSGNLKVAHIFRDRHDAVWIGTEDAGLYRLYRGQVEQFTSRDGLSSNKVMRIFEDREGSI
jgi:streptogramin lyase